MPSIWRERLFLISFYHSTQLRSGPFFRVRNADRSPDAHPTNVFRTAI